MSSKKTNSTDLAGRYYEPEDYKKEDELSQGLAITHEQASDVMTEGEIKPVIENVNGEDIEIPRVGYTEDK
ncbi:YozQ family protein [Litchfieldia alkalitelluris]|uniref:YozQ family protein n=1 Tax=Litchfieldia alkalitelluris TaxID=304268 RepID=UPI000996A30B|nr:YozQ family protein [Litchfieldia alkalitelluris]